MVRIDMHTHSSASDGTDRPAEVMRRAKAAGLDVIALTDHDTVGGHEEALREAPAGLTFVPGMELSCRLDGHSVHLLAYLFDPNETELAAECDRIRSDRVRRAEAMVAKLADLGTGVTWEQVAAFARGGVVGRPHIARALAADGAVAEPAAAFTKEWIGMGGRAYVGRYALDPVRAIHLVRAAGGVTVLAHPRAGRDSWLLPDEAITRLAGEGLTGVEVRHPDQNSAERLRLTALADSLGLATSGGSDDHGSLTGRRLGCETAPPASYQRLTEAATGAAPVRT
ncbi:MAG TPA: PHP domain-containing protein [Streptosporangiaceae bacterium]